MLLEKLKALECSLHGDKRNERQWLEEVLHPDFREITRSGVMVDRQETIDSLAGEENGPTLLSSDFRLISMSENVALLHYRTVNPDGSRPSLRTSCWVCSANEKWLLVFHQGTPEAELLTR